MKTKERKLLTVTDIIIIIILPVVAALFMLQFLNTSGKTAVITVDGKEVRRINLEVASHETFTLDTEPQVTLKVADGTISFVDSLCPSKTCQHRGELKRAGDIAACVPAGVVVSITDDDTEADIDAVVG